MIAITGGAGFIGSALIAFLNRVGINDILVVDRDDLPHAQKLLSTKNFVAFVEYREFVSSLRSDSSIYPITAIVHLGACSSTTERDIKFLEEVNTNYSKSIIEYCTAKAIRCIYASSAATYGDGSNGYVDDEALLRDLKPLNPYGHSKHLVDLWASETGMLSEVVALKFFNVYGPNEYFKGDMASIVWKAFNTIRERSEFSLFKSHNTLYRDGEQMRDFVYVKDCCRVIHWLLDNPQVNGLYNVGSGRARSWNDLLTAIFTNMELPVRINYVDMPESIRHQYQYFTEAPMGKLRLSGYAEEFSSIEDGIRDYILNHLMKRDQIW
jgi:ADP-L-glycero-D-manno-heptose 6-epimerase